MRSTRSSISTVGVCLVTAAFAAIGCSSSETETSSTKVDAPGSTPGPAASASAFTVETSAFDDGEAIPVEFTCDGANESPSLTWTDVPADTGSLALVMDDPDAPLPEPFVHWVVVGIDPSTNEIPAGASVGTEGTNGSGSTGYLGPCPPPGDPHTYHFTLYALAEPPSDAGAAPDAAAVQAMGADALGTAELTGTYQRAG